MSLLTVASGLSHHHCESFHWIVFVNDVPEFKPQGGPIEPEVKWKDTVGQKHALITEYVDSERKFR